MNEPGSLGRAESHFTTGPEGLFWEGQSLRDLALDYGTPLYVVSRCALEEAYHALVKTFRDEGVVADVFFSFKTNPVPDVLRVLVAAGAGAEVISVHELQLARSLGVPGTRIVVNGTVKTLALLEEAVAAGALINAESVQELRLLEAIAARTGRRVRVGLRINPMLKQSRFDFTVSTGTRTSPMGFMPGGAEWKAALALLAAGTALHLEALHCHIGSGIQVAGPYREALAALHRCWKEVRQKGFQPSILDLGGGFQVGAIKALSLWEAVRLFGWRKPPSPPAAAKQTGLLRAVARSCRQLLQTLDASSIKLYLEPGRALCATAQLLLLRVERIVERPRGPVYALCDAGAMSLSPLLFTEYHTILLAGRPSEGPRQTYDLLGNMPTPLDIVAPGRVLPRLVPGDILAVLDVGAYFTMLGNTFAGPRPAIVILEAEGPVLARRRETQEDLFARDVRFSFETT